MGIFESFDRNRDISKILIKIEICKYFDQNCHFSQFWPKSRYISKLLTSIKKIEIFKYLGRHRDVSIKIKIFRKFWPNLKFSPISTKNRYFFKNLRTKIFEDIAQNRGITKIFTKIETFKDFDQNRYFSKILTKIAIFLTFGQNPDC